MYTIHANGELLFSSYSENVETIALSPKVSLDVNDSGSVEFVLPPGNRMHGGLKKLKSIITVEQDGEQIARGRVMETETDTYNQQSVYCEGDKSFLMDSVFSPGELSGKVHDFFRTLISNHNKQVDAEKQFTVGIIDAVGADAEMNPESRNETRVYWSTHDMIEDSLLNVYGGYIRTRTVGGVHYIDWLAQYGDVNTQPIEFTVNMLDLTAKADAGDVFTVLIPLGVSEIGEDGEYTDPLSIASVNGGLNYIQDDEAVALYGKIWRTKTWSYIEDPAQLLARGREYLKTGVALETITLKAIDMHFVDGNVQPIRLGDRVRILSNPHGIDKVMICSQIEIDLLNPENTVYTFGEKPRTLTDNVVKTEQEVGSLGGGGGRKSVKEEVSDIIRWARIFTDETNAYIELSTGQYNTLSGELSQAKITLDGLDSKITLQAKDIELKADQVTIDNLINGYTSANVLDTNVLQAQNVNTTYFKTDAFNLGDTGVGFRTLSMGDIASASFLASYTTQALDLQHSHEVTVNADGTITLGEVSSSGGTFKIADTAYYKNGVSAAEREGYEDGKTDWCPVEIERSGYSTTDKTVTVRALNAAGVPVLGLEEIDASEIYEAGANAAGGYDAGWAAAVNDSKIMNSELTITNTAANTFFATVRVWIRFADGTPNQQDVHYKTITKTQTIQVGQ